MGKGIPGLYEWIKARLFITCDGRNMPSRNGTLLREELKDGSAHNMVSQSCYYQPTGLPPAPLSDCFGIGPYAADY